MGLRMHVSPDHGGATVAKVAHVVACSHEVLELPRKLLHPRRLGLPVVWKKVAVDHLVANTRDLDDRRVSLTCLDDANGHQARNACRQQSPMRPTSGISQMILRHVLTQRKQTDV